MSFACFNRRVEDCSERRRDDVVEPSNCAVTLVTSHDLDQCSHLFLVAQFQAYSPLLVHFALKVWLFFLDLTESMMFICVSFALMFQLLISQQWLLSSGSKIIHFCQGHSCAIQQLRFRSISGSVFTLRSTCEAGVYVWAVPFDRDSCQVMKWRIQDLAR